MKFEGRMVGTITVFAFEGPMTLSVVDELKTFLDAVNSAVAQGRRQIALDLSRVSYIDSTGLSILVQCYSKVHGAEGKMAVVASPKLREVLRNTGLDKVFGLADTVDDLIPSLT